ncbi:MAG: NADH-quinone oxidoreductase subunit N [Bacteroidia bacterium]
MLVFLPLVLLATGILVSVVTAAFGKKKLTRGVTALSLLGCLVTSLPTVSGLYQPKTFFSEMLWLGGTYGVWHVGFCFLGLVALLLGLDTLRAEAETLLLLSTAGLIILSSANHLIMVFLGLEMVAFASYVLAGIVPKNSLAIEGAYKYFLWGAAMTAVFLLGISYLYGITGQMYFHILQGVPQTLTTDPLYLMAWVFIGTAILFKLAVVPFHVWAADVYGSAPRPAVGWIATAGKLSAIFLAAVFLWRLPINDNTKELISYLGAIAALIANLLAIQQKDLFRLLGYSSAAQGGYLLLGLVSSEGILASLIYAFLYGFMLLFTVHFLQSLPKTWQGWGYQKSQALGASVGLLAIAGVPPFPGFVGKYLLFLSAYKAGFEGPVFLALIAALVGMYAYWSPIAQFYAAKKSPSSIAFDWRIAAWVLLLLVVAWLPTYHWGWMDYFYGLGAFFTTR